MNSRNILIFIGVLVIGVLLYKLLLGFVLPIALLVSLGYILKFLLKKSDPDQELQQVLTNSSTPSSIENIVEIKPIKEEKPIEEDKPEKPIEEEKNT